MSIEKYLEALDNNLNFTDQLQLNEAGTQHPLPGHDYHRKTDAELKFIQRDAKEAEDAMSGHNSTAANKYADQKNDATTVLHFRKKGMPDWYKKKYGHIKEEVETIEEGYKELDDKEKRKEKIRKFIKKQSTVKIKPQVKEEVELEESEKNKRIHQAIADTEKYIENESKRDPKLRPKEVQDRLDWYTKHREKLKGMLENVELYSLDIINEALPPHLAKLVDEKGNLKDPKKQKEFEKSRDKWKNKFTVKDVTPKGYGPNEEVEHIDELSNELLDRYKKKAGESAREADAKGDFKKGHKRFKGIIKATNKQFDNDLKKEDVDYIELDEAVDFKIGKVYHQEYNDGSKTYFKPTEKLKNGRHKGLMSDTNKYKNKAKNGTAESGGYWKETPDHEVPKHLKEEVEYISEELEKHMKTLTDTLTNKSKSTSHEGLHTEFSVEKGKKYHKIVATTNAGKGQKSVHAFVDKDTGDLYKAASWKAPAKGARYNLHKDIEHLKQHADPYTGYLYKHK